MADRVDVTPSAADQQRQANFSRDVLSKMGVDQRLGQQVPGDVAFQDEHGRTIKFGDLYGSRPIVIMPMFFECKGVCGVETDSLLQAIIQMQDLSVGRDFDIVMLSINPKETPDLTLSRWNNTVRLYNVHGDRPDGEKGFHFLTGTLPNIRRVTDALGFKWVYDAEEDLINHPAGLMVLSPTGKITGYLVNKEFPRVFLAHLIADATDSKISAKTESVLFGCIMIDHATGRRSLVIENVIRLTAAVFAVGLACWIVGMSFSGKKGKAKGGLV
jgi:protein SCO1